MVSGSIYSPSLFYLLSDLRSFSSQFVYHLPLSHPTTSMINLASFPHAPPSYRYINPAHKNSKNQVVDGTNLLPQPTFVDETIMT